jgi:hypothetical protein
MIDHEEDSFYDASFFTPMELSMIEHRSIESISRDISSGKIPTFIGENGETYIAPDYFNN